MMAQQPLDTEGQKFMALAGLRMWSRAVITQAKRIESVASTMDTDMQSPQPRIAEAEHMLDFNAERHLFVIAAYKLSEHVSWATELDFLDGTLFTEIAAKAAAIKHMRDLNEHALEYFRGDGKRPQEWIYADVHGAADASSTVDSLIGGRLDYNEVRAIAENLLDRLPKAYSRARDGIPSQFVISWNPFKTSPA